MLRRDDAVESTASARDIGVVNGLLGGGGRVGLEGGPIGVGEGVFVLDGVRFVGLRREGDGAV